MSVNNLWSDSVPVEELNNVDFERRGVATSITDSFGRYTAIAEALGEQWELGKSAATDRAVRIYLAHLIDSGEVDDYRSEHEIRQLIPQSGWVDDYEKPSIEVDEEENESANLAVTLPPTVKEIADSLVEDGEFDSFTDVTQSSLDFFADE